MHARVLEQMLEGEMDAHLSYEKPSPSNSNSGNSRNSSYEKKIQTQQGEFELIVVPKHQTPWLIHKTAGNLFVCQRHECFGHRRGNERNLRHHPFNLRHIHYHQQNITGDSTSAVDSETELRIRKELSRVLQDTTVLIITQRINTMQSADRVIVLEDGEVETMGTPEELLKNSRVYQEIYSSQQILD